MKEHLTILFVGEGVTITKRLKSELEDLGISVSMKSANTEKELDQYLSSQSFDLIFADPSELDNPSGNINKLTENKELDYPLVVVPKESDKTNIYSSIKQHVLSVAYDRNNGTNTGSLITTRQIPSVKTADVKFACIQSIATAAKMGIWQFDVHLKMFSFNLVLEQELGCNSGELSSVSLASFLEIIHPEDVGSFKEFLNNLKNKTVDNMLSTELRLKHKTGDWHWFYCRGNGLDNTEESNLVGGTITDASERKERESFLYTVLNDSPLPKFIYRVSDYSIVASNKSAYKLYGYSKSEVEKINVAQIFSRDQAIKEVEELTSQLINGREVKDRITKHKDKSGRQIDVTINASLTSISNEDVVILVAQDITSVLKNSQELELLSLVASTTTNGVIITNANQEIIWINDSFSRISGYKWSEVKGKRPQDFLHGEGTDEKTRAEIRYALKIGKPVRVEIINYNKKGEAYWIELFISPVLDKNGKSTRFVGVQNDISSRKEAESNLKSTLQNLELLVDARTSDLKEAHHKLEVAHLSVTDSIKYARQIQVSMLPSEQELQHYLPNSYVYFRPKDVVSGDFYWIKEIDDRIYFAVVDCTGHGVPGALMSMLGVEMLESIIVQRKIRRPGYVLEEMDYALFTALQREESRLQVMDGMDMFLGVFDKDFSNLEYSSAKSYGALLRDDEEPYKLEADNLSIGGYDCGTGKQFRTFRMELYQGDQLFFYSDGMIDQFGGEKRKRLKSRNFIELLKQQKDRKLWQQENAIEEFYSDWMANEFQTDDMTLLSVKI